jgi:hypothetical protein
MSSLLLHPLRTDWLPEDRRRLVERLSQAGLLTVGGDASDGWFLTGEDFLSLVTFLGCAPNIKLAPEPGDSGQDYCRVSVQEYRDVPRFLYAGHLPAPRCPACRSVVSADPAAMAPDTGIACTGCGTRTPLHSLDWKRAAGYARVFVEIAGIYPGEALPTDGLLSMLAEISSGGWRYFYV